MKNAIRRAPVDIVTAFENHPYWRVRRNGRGTYDVLHSDGTCWIYALQGLNADTLGVWYTATAITTAEEGRNK